MKAQSWFVFVFISVQATVGTEDKCFFRRFPQHPVHILEGQCEKKCDQNPHCTHYQAEPLVFHFRLGTLENCYLLTGNVSWSDSKPATKKTCGIKNIWRRIGDDYFGTKCLFEYQQYRAYPLESGEDCFQLCKEHSRCSHFNFIKDGNHRSCQLMQGVHKGMKGVKVVAPKVHQAITCGFLKDYKLEKIDDIKNVEQEELKEDYTQYYYYAGAFGGGFLSALILYLLCCTCTKTLTKSPDL
jgi:hypothetical protein